MPQLSEGISLGYVSTDLCLLERVEDIGDAVIDVPIAFVRRFAITYYARVLLHHDLGRIYKDPIKSIADV